ncbi:DUF885 domain-containing protein [Glutamicibacter sp. NPDC087344]|uniref:DUF885 domain-containing protein n=1 Tax=Glutamicibacter sp. NPDC087344 TaxID=3363994 RepID=UPI00382B123E
MNTQSTPRTPTAIDAVADEHFERTLEIYPELGAELGLPGYESLYGDYSPAGTQRYAEVARATLANLAQVHPEDDIDRVTLDAMQERLGLEVEIIETGRTELNNIACPAQEIRAIFDLMPQESAQDFAHVAQRLKNLPEAMDGYIESLRLSASNSLIAAQRQVKIVIEQSTDYAKDGGFFDDLATQGRTVDLALHETLAAGAEAAKGAYRKLASVLENELLPLAPAKDAVGRERYALASRDFLGATVDLEETYAWGVEELDRIISEQERVAQLIKPGASIAQAKEILNADPARKLAGKDALREWMQNKADSAVRDLSGTHFEIPAPMDRIECMIAPTEDGGIYYTGPSEDFSRPGRMWWSIPPGEDEFTTWSELTTVYHEGVPGHHLQVGTAQLQAQTLNKWRRNLCWVSGHGEGWALYSERLMQQLGYLDDPGDYMGMLGAQRMRAARVVFDIGVHLELEVPAAWGEGTWTPEKGYEFLRANFDDSPGQLDFEFTRYLGWPGQAPSYKVGQRLWEQIRDELAARDGENFDIKAFHTRALKLGSVGLDTLKRALLDG